jgi:Peptidase C10 family/Spi protease inhibitor/Carboxypeptidase regulatory-like domain/MAM domain, meprin/A5/mu
MQIKVFISKVLPTCLIQSNAALRVCRSRRWAGTFKAVFAGLLLLGFSSGGFGEPVSVGQAENAVMSWLKANPSPLQTVMGQKITQAQTFTNADGTTLYYVLSLAPDGFVIVAADDLVEPIVGFAPGGRFDPSPANPLGALVSRDLPGRIAEAKGLGATKAYGSFLAARNKWAQLESARQMDTGMDTGLSSVSDVRVPPLTHTTWDQSTVDNTLYGNACYNYYTPPYAAGNSQNYVCGCVATAMAQLMRYWQYPVNGVGTASFTIYVTDVQQSRSLMGGNGAGGAYDWADMVLSPNSSSTLVQRQAIGALCADAGVSVSMDYNMQNSGSSGAYLEDVPDALTQTFEYANAVHGDNDYAGGGNIGAGLIGMINPNLDAGCPVLLGISGEGGHAVVCDGYGYSSSTLYHHLNLGWSGDQTAWYNLPNINTAYYSFDSIDVCVYNVWTNGTGEIISGRVTDSGGNPIAGVVVTATRTGGGTYLTTNNSNGIYALAKIPSSSTYTVSASKAGCVFTSQNISTGQSIDDSITSGNQWAVNFVQTDSNNPTSFLATPVNSSRIDLSWGKNPSGDNVLVAWNTSATFGVPSGTYAVGDPISGGGTVLYNGGATTVSHTGLTSGTTCYYKAWSVRSGPGYSSGATSSATTPHDFSFTENFEHGGAMPGGWTQQYVVGSAGWTSQNGGYYGNPSSAHGGSYNALLYYSGYGYRTKLITPALNFGSATRNAQLTFWQCMQNWGGDQDQLWVYYRTSAGGSWNLLTSYTSEVPSWTLQTVSLPNPNSSYYVAFEGNANYGYGVCIDDVTITADNPLPPCLNIALSGANLILNCTNGSASGTYYVLASTNIAMPSANWTVIATNSFDGNGCSLFTNAMGNNSPQRYFRIRLP